jgi:hypothetical protein
LRLLPGKSLPALDGDVVTRAISVYRQGNVNDDKYMSFAAAGMMALPPYNADNGESLASNDK